MGKHCRARPAAHAADLARPHVPCNTVLGGGTEDALPHRRRSDTMAHVTGTKELDKQPLLHPKSSHTERTCAAHTIM